MGIKDARIDMRAMTETGRIGHLLAIYNNGAVDIVFGDDRPMRMWASELTPVSDPCASCEMAPVITSQCKQIADLQAALDEMTCKSNAAHRNAAYWREELTKLQKEALAETQHFYCDDERKPAEVAKIYIQVEPEKLLMSDDAKIVCELLEGSGPMTSREIAVRLMIREICVLESIIEARDAGKISLVDGKYEIVRD